MLTRLAGWQANQLASIDESAAKERTADRKTGWAPIGKKAHTAISAQRSQRWSISPDYKTEGYIIWVLIQSSTKELCNAFIIEKLLPLCNSFPGPRSVIIMDNARIHHSEVCDRFGSFDLELTSLADIT